MADDLPPIIGEGEAYAPLSVPLEHPPLPEKCSPDADENGCSTKPTECTCTVEFGCGEGSEAGCCWCRHEDIYMPCPKFGFMCDPYCGTPGEGCCTPEQIAATDLLYGRK